MATVINDDVESAIFFVESKQGITVGLVTLPYIDSGFAQTAFVIEIYPYDSAFAEVCFPHAEGGRSALRILIPADTDLKYVDSTVLELSQVARVMLGVPVRTPFVRTEETGKVIQIVSVQPSQHGLCDAYKAAVHAWSEIGLKPGLNFHRGSF